MPPHLLPPEEEPGKWVAALQAAAVYIVAVPLLFISGSFQSGASAPMIEHISLINVTQPPPPPPPEPEPEPKPESAPQPLKKAEAKPDIALQEKKKRDERRKRDAERKKREEQKRKEEERRKKEEERKRKEQERRDEEKKRRDKEQEERDKERARIAAAEEAEKAAERARQLNNERGVYLNRIEDTISRRARKVENVPVDPDIRVLVRMHLLPSGQNYAIVNGLDLIESSGYPEYDKSVMRDIQQIGEFSIPRNPELRDEFLLLTVGVCPVECND